MILCLALRKLGNELQASSNETLANLLLSAWKPKAWSRRGSKLAESTYSGFTYWKTEARAILCVSQLENRSPNLGEWRRDRAKVHFILAAVVERHRGRAGESIIK